MIEPETMESAPPSAVHAAAGLPTLRVPWPKALIVMAHPDDEYALAATAYRISRELGGFVDHVVITNGEGGYRYASLAEAIYGVAMAGEPDGRANLPAIRRQEVVRAGQVLGVRRHYFLEQKDSGFDGECASAQWQEWDCAAIRTALADLFARESYDFVFTLMPSGGCHGHHLATALLVLEAVAGLAEARRPVVLGVDVGRMAEPTAPFAGLEGHPLTRTAADAPAIVFDRNAPFGHQPALNYQIVANWVIAEHKSQGLFQTDYSRYDAERFWAFALSPNALERARELGRRLEPTARLDDFSPDL